MSPRFGTSQDACWVTKQAARPHRQSCSKRLPGLNTGISPISPLSAPRAASTLPPRKARSMSADRCAISPLRCKIEFVPRLTSARRCSTKTRLLLPELFDNWRKGCADARAGP